MKTILSKSVNSPRSIPAEPYLKVTDLNYSRGLEPVFSNLNVTLSAGESIALAGPSGCGKTTFMNLCAGLLDVEEGTIENRFGRIGYVFQSALLLPWKTASDNMALGLKAQGMESSLREERCVTLARAMGLKPDDLKKYPHQLSGGMQNRIALGRALVMEPDLILLDEPFSALDIGLKHELYHMLMDLRRPDSALLFITHDILEAIRLADRILLMSGRPGELVAEIQIDAPFDARDEGFVLTRTAEMLRNPIVRSALELPQLQLRDGGTKNTLSENPPVRIRRIGKKMSLPSGAC